MFQFLDLYLLIFQKNLIDSGESGTFDVAFIDADKESYQQYCDNCKLLIRPGGIIAVDNVNRDSLLSRFQFLHGIT